MRTKITTLRTSYRAQLQQRIANWLLVINRTGRLLFAVTKLVFSSTLQVMALVSHLQPLPNPCPTFAYIALEYSTSINRVSTPGGKTFTPAKVIAPGKLETLTCPGHVASTRCVACITKCSRSR